MYKTNSKRSRRVLSQLLIVAMLLALVPADFSTVDAAGLAEYQPNYLEIGVLNARSMEVDEFLKKLVRVNSSQFNLIGDFSRGGAAYAPPENKLKNPPASLGYDTALMQKENGGGSWRGNYSASLSYPRVQSLIDRGQIKASFSADLYADAHDNAKYHFGLKANDLAFVKLLSYGPANTANYLAELRGDKDDPDEKPVLYGSDWVNLPAKNHSFGLIFGSTGACECGSSKVSHLSFRLADVAYPYVTNIDVTSDPDGNNGKSDFKLGDKGYIQLYFSEDIRFSDNTAPESGSVKLDLELADARTKATVSGHGYTADLVGLYGNRLVFEFAVPEKINGMDTDFIIMGIRADAAAQATWIDLKNQNPPSFKLVHMSASTAIDTSEGAYKIDSNELNLASSRITDIAGNPVNWGASVKKIDDIKIDAVSPGVANVNIYGARINTAGSSALAEGWPTDLDRSTVFAGFSGVADICGNLAPAAIVLGQGAGELKAPKQELWLDTVPPEITTALTPDNNGVYTPIYYDQNDKSSFCFPITPKDKGNYNLGDYTSGADRCHGTLSLYTGINSRQPLFYTINQSIARPSYYDNPPFLQVENIQTYVHIKLIDDVAYDFENFYINIWAHDYAQNTGFAFFKLDAFCDRVAPNIRQTGENRYYSAGQGSIAAEITVKDNTSDLAEVYYAWQDTEPGPGDWLAAPDFVPNAAKEAKFLTIGPLKDDGFAGMLRLWVKAMDKEGNETEPVGFDYNLDFTKAVANIEFKFDREAPLGDTSPFDIYHTGRDHGYSGNLAHPIEILPPALYGGADSMIDKTNATTVFMIKNQLSANPNNYFLRVFDKNTVEKRVYAPFEEDSANSWYNADVTFDGAMGFAVENFAAVPAIPANGTGPRTGLAETLLDLWVNYYGEQDAIVVTMYGSWTAGDSIPIDGNTAIDYYKFLSAQQPYAKYQEAPTHKITFDAPRSADGLVTEDKAAKKIVAGVGDWLYDPNSPASAPPFAHSLDGVQFPFRIENLLMPDWGADDIDFEKSTVTLLYKGVTPGGFDAEEILVQSLSTMSPEESEYQVDLENHIFTVAHGLLTKSGYYRLEVHLAPKNGCTDGIRASYTDIFLLNAAPLEFGISGYDISTLYKSIVVHSNNRFPVYGEWKYFDEIKLGSFVPSDEVTRSASLMFGFTAAEAAAAYEVPASAYESSNVRHTAVAYYKYWNAADPAGEGNAVWTRGQAQPYFINEGDAFQYGEEDDGTGRVYGRLPLIDGRSNTVYCRVALQNGYISPKRETTVNIADKAPRVSGAIGAGMYDWQNNFVPGGAQAYFTDAGSENGEIVHLGIFMENELTGGVALGHIQELSGGPPNNFPPVNLDRPATYVFLAVDEFGNAAADKIKADYIDGIAPYNITIANLTSSADSYHVRLTAYDNLPFTEQSKLTMILGVSGGSDSDAVIANVPMNLSGGGEWTSANGEPDSHAAIFRTGAVCEKDGGVYRLTVDIEGYYPYIDALGGTIGRTLYFDVFDEAGNRAYDTSYSPDQKITLANTNNIPAKCTGVTYENGRVVFAFNKPVKVLSPKDMKDMNPTPQFAATTDSLPIYANGDYDIEFTDLFGKRYTQTVTVNCIAGFQMRVSIIPSGPTNGNVAVFIDTSEFDGIKIRSVAAGVPKNAETAIDSGGKYAQITAFENDTLSVVLTNGLTEEKKYVSISNIDRSPPIVEVVYTYLDPNYTDGDAVTYDEVIAGLKSNKSITVTNGGAIHIFTQGSPKKHTFEYIDHAGNTGNIEASITANIDLSGKTDPGTEPDFTAAASIKIGGQYSAFDSFAYEGDLTGFRALIDGLPTAQGYKLDFASKTAGVKLIVKTSGAPPPGYSSPSDSIPGVSAAFLTVIIGENAEFDLYLIDRFGNYVKMELSFDKVNGAVIGAKVIYVNDGFNIVRAYFVPDANSVSLTNTSGLIKETAGVYIGLYYRLFTANGSYIFTYTDAAGNTGSVTATVSSFDTAPMQVKSISWGANYRAKLTNQSVTAMIATNKDIADITAVWTQGGGKVEDGYISISFFKASASITYLKNAPAITLEFSSKSGSELILCAYQLPEITNIDKENPEITVLVTLAEDKRSALVSFTSNKDVYCTEITLYDVSGKPCPGTSFKTKITANGEYGFSFNDAAGNIVKKSVTVAGIDTVPLKMQFNTAANDAGAANNPGALAFDSGDTIYVKVNKDNCKISYNDAAPLTAAKDTWHGFVVPADYLAGANIITATYYGETISACFYVTPPDTAPPWFC